MLIVLRVISITHNFPHSFFGFSFIVKNSLIYRNVALLFNQINLILNKPLFTSMIKN